MYKIINFVLIIMVDLGMFSFRFFLILVFLLINKNIFGILLFVFIYWNIKKDFVLNYLYLYELISEFLYLVVFFVKLFVLVIELN